MIKITITLSFLLGSIFGSIYGSYVTGVAFRDKVIEIGCGEYNKTTGKFQFNNENDLKPTNTNTNQTKRRTRCQYLQ